MLPKVSDILPRLPFSAHVETCVRVGEKLTESHLRDVVAYVELVKQTAREVLEESPEAMAQQISGDGFALYFDRYDSGEVDTLDFATVETSRHSVIRRDCGATVATLMATWGDHDMIRIQGSGKLTPGILDMAWWRMTDAASTAHAEFEIVPPLG